MAEWSRANPSLPFPATWSTLHGGPGEASTSSRALTLKRREIRVGPRAHLSIGGQGQAAPRKSWHLSFEIFCCNVTCVCVCVCVRANRGTHKGRKVPMPWYGYGYHAVPVSTPVRAYDSCRSLKMKTSLTMLLFPSHSEP